MNRIRRIIQAVALRPIMRLLGLHIRGRNHLDIPGPAILVANLNSHVDTAALMAAVPNRILPRVRPAAAADYFLRNRFAAWLSTRLVGIVAVDRCGTTEDPLRGCTAALRRGEIVIVFPEGTRGQPEVPQPFRRGVAHLIRANPDVPVIPIRIVGAGRVLPKGARFPRHLGIQVTVGTPLSLEPSGPIAATTESVEEAVWSLAA
mgnify:CR=1 FL=1